MTCRLFLNALLALFVVAPCCHGGVVYRITAADGAKDVTYEVKFGGGRKFEQFTAYDPASKKFVYLQWKRDGDKPAPAGAIWDHNSGATLALYRFPGVAQPLPVIPSIDDLKICPKTGSKKLTKQKHIIYD
jgi:hypothetical protein